MVKEMQTVTLHIGGMTCQNCQDRTERALCKAAGVASAVVRLAEGKAIVVYDKTVINSETLTKIVTDLGYTALPHDTPKWRALVRSTGLLALIGLLYLALERFGLLNLFAPSMLATVGTGYGMLFVIGLLTSVHCIAMCGGINLSQCMGGQTLMRDGQKTQIKPALLYNLGRVISYTAIGFLVGALGATISFSYALQGVLKVVAGVFMLMMGFGMLGLFPSLSRLIPRLPTGIARWIGRSKHNGKGPLVVGLLNGLMPCGPLQAMQLYALSTGNAFSGALSMLLFSLGTVPLMFGLGTLSTALGKRFTRQVMAAGAVLVAVLGLSMFTQGASLAGWFQGYNTSQIEASILQSEDFVAGGSMAQEAKPALEKPLLQSISSTLTPNRYPNITVQVGVPVEWVISAPRGSINGCNDQMFIPEYDITHAFVNGDNLIAFTPDKLGTFTYTCWMGMIRATITVVEGSDSIGDAESETAKPQSIFSIT